MVAHTIQNLPAMRKTQVRSLGREDPLEKGVATHSWFFVFFFALQYCTGFAIH